MQSLDELRRVIQRIETRRPPRPAAPTAHEVLAGGRVETGAGPLLVVRREYPLTHTHGRQPLASAFAAPLDLLSAVSRAEVPARDPRGLLFLDTETTGLAGGTGTYAFLVGVGRLDGDRGVVAQYFMRDFDEERALLAALVPLLEQAAGIVPFNGSAFDLPRPAALAGPAARRVRLRLARWEKRPAGWDAACALWETARYHDAFDREPWEEIAKFHEHRRRDLPAARAIVAQALEVADTAGAAPRVLDAFTHRLSRLERRLRRHR